MNLPVTYTERARLPITTLQDVLVARFVGREQAAGLGFAPAIQTRIATVISEIARNVVQHAGRPGAVQFAHVADGKKSGLRIIVTDTGEGIPHPERFSNEGPPGALGAGLPGARRLADHFNLESKPGAGATVTMDFWLREETR